jgi:transcriptional regulator with XRE-family HTH domain
MVKASLRGRAQDVDRHIGARLRERRIMLGLTRQRLADQIGVTNQQAHKYERGTNQMAASRLYKAAQVLGVEVSYFFEELQSGGTFRAAPQQRLLAGLVKNFVTARPEHQRVLSSLVRTLADSGRETIGPIVSPASRALLQTTVPSRRKSRPRCSSLVVGRAGR